MSSIIEHTLNFSKLRYKSLLTKKQKVYLDILYTTAKKIDNNINKNILHIDGKCLNFSKNIINIYNNNKTGFLDFIDTTFKKYDFVFIYNMIDPVYYYNYNSNKIIEIGYTNKCNGVEFDFWALYSGKHFKKYLNDEILLQRDGIKTYLCYQCKDRVHRRLLTDSFITNNLISKGIISYNNCIYKNIDFRLQIDLKTEYFAHNKEMDYDSFKKYKVNDIYTLGPLSNWNKCFLNIVSETINCDTAYKKNCYVFLSEKTFKPIIGLRPFIINGSTAIYKWLKKAKFDIFEDLWCGYNLIDIKKDSELVYAITKIVEFYSTKTSIELYDIYISLLPRLQKNRTKFFEYVDDQQNRINNIHEYIPIV